MLLQKAYRINSNSDVCMIATIVHKVYITHCTSLDVRNICTFELLSIWACHVPGSTGVYLFTRLRYGVFSSKAEW